MHDYNVHEVFYINYEIHDQFKNYGHEILEQHPPHHHQEVVFFEIFCNRIRTFVVLWRRQSQIIHNSPGSEDPVRGIHSIGRLWIRTHITYLPSRLWGGQGEDRKNQCVYPIKGLLWTVGTPLNHVYIIDVVTEQKTHWIILILIAHLFYLFLVLTLTKSCNNHCLLYRYVNHCCYHLE